MTISIRQIAPAFGSRFTGNQGYYSGISYGFGQSVYTAGDVNGDGIGDFVIAGRNSSVDETYSIDFCNGNYGTYEAQIARGAVFVVFGSADGLDPLIDLSALDGTNGFVITEIGDYQSGPLVISGGGDVNGGGFADVIVGRSNKGTQFSVPYRYTEYYGATFEGTSYYQTGAVYVVFGGEAPTAVTDLGALDGTNGFTVTLVGDPSTTSEEPSPMPET